MSARITRSVTVRPVRTEADYEATLRQIDGLMDAVPGTPEGDRLDVLVALVQAYEARHHRITPPDPVDAIRFRMEQEGLRPRDLEPYIGSRGRVSEVLNRQRALTLPMIRRLTDGLGIAAEVLVREGAPSAPRKRSTRAEVASRRTPRASPARASGRVTKPKHAKGDKR